jgi:hypothetical protein
VDLDQPVLVGLREVEQRFQGVEAAVGYLHRLSGQ